MSQQKFASNVIEKCLAFGSPDERQLLVNEMLGTSDENEPLQVGPPFHLLSFEILVLLRLETIDYSNICLSLNLLSA